ncbi:MAG: ribbon-helix-helix protein, CopG family [Rhizobiales bacterium]|nr:ribbon-helix-helix protein, CopG family [Hyphomicrobiales bacterium]
MPTTAETFSVRLPEDLKNEVDALAKLTKRSRSFIIKEATAAYVEEQRDYLKAIDEALVEAKSGVGHSSEQVFRWMRSWGTEDEYALPEPDIRPNK